MAAENLSENLSKSGSLQKEEQLIELIRDRPFLYDISHKQYKDKDRKENAWKDIERELKLSDGLAKRMWDALKKQYTTYLKKLKDPSGSGAKKSPYFRHAGIMSFYQAVYRPYKLVSNLDEDDEAEDDEIEQENANDTGADFAVEYEGFGDGSPPEVIVETTKSASMPKLSKQRAQKRRLDSDYDQRIIAAIERTETDTADEFEHFGAYVAGRIRKLNAKSPRHAAMLQLEMQKLVTEFELKSLDEELKPATQHGEPCLGLVG